MTRLLRQVHRWTFLLLAPAFAAALVVALATRNPMPEPSAGVAGLVRADPAAVTTEIGGVFLGRHARVEVGTLDGNPYVTVLALDPHPLPDLHLYWCPEEPGRGTEELPPGSLHVGALGEARHLAFPLPAGALPGEGALALFSLADRTTVVAAPFELR